MRSLPLFSIRKWFFSAFLTLIPAVGTVMALEQRFEFASAPLGPWNLEQEAPALRISNQTISLQVQEVSEGPSRGPSHVLEMTGDHRGFRNVKDFTPPLKEGVIRFDLRVKSGGLLVTAFESSQSKETMGRGVRLLYLANGKIESYFGTSAGDDAPKIHHASYKQGIWYRNEVKIHLNEGGGGSYSLQITDLSTGENLPLEDAKDIPIDPILFSIGGWDFNLLRRNSNVELDNLLFSPNTKEAQ